MTKKIFFCKPPVHGINQCRISRAFDWYPILHAFTFFMTNITLWGYDLSFCQSVTFCPRRTIFVGDYEVACSCSLSVTLCQTLSYLLNQASEVYETLPVLFLCQWEHVYQFSEKFIKFYYPLPIIFVVIFYWT